MQDQIPYLFENYAKEARIIFQIFILKYALFIGNTLGSCVLGTVLQCFSTFFVNKLPSRILRLAIIHRYIAYK